MISSFCITADASLETLFNDLLTSKSFCVTTLAGDLGDLPCLSGLDFTGDSFKGLLLVLFLVGDFEVVRLPLLLGLEERDLDLDPRDFDPLLLSKTAAA